jgi:hypothetical protein
MKRAFPLSLALGALAFSNAAFAVESMKWSLETALDIPTQLPFTTLDYSLLSTMPQPLVLGTEVRCEGDEWFCNGLRGYADAGFIKYPFSSAAKSISMFSFEMGGRYFPWAGPFYASLGVGLRKNTVNADLNTFQIAQGVQATDAELSLFSIYAAPELGAQFPLGRGWSLALACGLQYSLYSSGSLTFYNRNTGQNSSNDPTLATQSASEIDRIAGLLILRTALRFSYAF